MQEIIPAKSSGQPAVLYRLAVSFLHIIIPHIDQPLARQDLTLL